MERFLYRYDIQMRPVPSGRPQENPIGNRDIVHFVNILTSKNAEPDGTDSLHAIRAIHISNDLYGLDTLSVFEMTKGFTKPLLIDLKPIPFDEELHTAHDALIVNVKRKFSPFLRSSVFPPENLKGGDIVQMFITDEHQNVEHVHHFER